MKTAKLTRLGMCAALFLLFPFDGSGSAVLLLTRFRLQGETDVTTENKIYHWSDSPTGEWTRVGLGLPYVSPHSSYFTGNLFMAAGGSISGWQEHSSGILIALPSPPRTILNGIELPDGFPTSTIAFSANGRYVIGWAPMFTGNDPFSIAPTKPSLLDTASGQVQQLPMEITSDTRMPKVADDGTVVYRGADTGSGNSTLVVRNSSGVERNIEVEGNVGELQLAPKAAWVATTVGSNVVAVSLTSGVQRTIADADSAGALWGVSDHELSYITVDHHSVRTLNLDSGETSIVFQWSVELKHIAVAGYSGMIWISTAANRLIRIEEGTASQLLPPLGTVSTMQVASKGSAFLLGGGIFAADVTVTVRGKPWPIAARDAKTVWVQAPWDWVEIPDLWTSGGGFSARGDPLLVRTVANPFEAFSVVSTQGDFWPRFIDQPEDASPDGITAIVAHDDFHGVVTAADPAHPGEVLHAYMTGLGELETPLPTGTPGPLNADAAVHPLACTGGESAETATSPVTLIGKWFAPAMIGFYQVDIEVPPNVPDGFWFLRCLDSHFGDSAWIPTRP